MPLTSLEQRLQEIQASGHRVTQVDLYGGEVMLLPKGYVQELKSILHSYEIQDIEVITNLTALNPAVVDDPDFGISVSYDFQFRERHEEVWGNLLRLERPFSVLTLGTPEVLQLDPLACLAQLDLLAQLTSWEIKPYSSNQANQATLSFRSFERFVQSVLEAPRGTQYSITNEYMVQDAVAGKRNAFSDDHVYITPTGKFAVLEFDLNDHEYFKELEGFQQYVEWCAIEKSRVYRNGICGSCEFMGKCLSEHLRHVKDLDHSCNGFINLLLWGKNHYKDVA